MEQRMETVHKNSLTLQLEEAVENHTVLKSDWLLEKSENLSLKSLHLWLSQEYFVSVDFVNWFLITASLTDNQEAKTILVENIWEELGEGNTKNSHVSILIQFLQETGFNFENHILFQETKIYLDTMRKIIARGFLFGLGALGPANEYLLKLEYGKMYQAYRKLASEKTLPRAHFFEVNLHADESHSAKMFRLIENSVKTDADFSQVMEGNLSALEARKLFYEGLKRKDG